VYTQTLRFLYVKEEALCRGHCSTGGTRRGGISILTFHGLLHNNLYHMKKVILIIVFFCCMLRFNATIERGVREPSRVFLLSCVVFIQFDLLACKVTVHSRV
jgi:hypothetical protein